ncbi:hypothetical protein Dimus_000128 [Dionaea muscipula]
METLISTASLPIHLQPSSYDEISMQQSFLFANSLKDLKNLRTQLYSAAEYFELSYTNGDQKQQILVNTLKDYAIKALVSTVDHLGSVTYKVNGLLDEKVEQVSATEFRVSCIVQRLRTCQEYIDKEGLFAQQLSSFISTPRHHKRYVLPAGETLDDVKINSSKIKGYNPVDEWPLLRSATRTTRVRETPRPSSRLLSSAGVSNRKGRSLSPSPRRSPQLLGAFSFSGAGATSKRDFDKGGLGVPKKSASMRVPGDDGGDKAKEIERYPSKSKRLLKALLSRRKSKKETGMLYTYLDE